MLVSIDDVITGALVNALAVAGRRITVAVDWTRDRRRAEDITTARWFETYRLTDRLPKLPELSSVSEEQVARLLRGDEIQAALHELLAARLTDADETDAGRAKDAFFLTFGVTDSDASVFARALADYYDDQICTLVARLEASDPSLLNQIRNAAFSTRMINILNAIERHTAALTSRPNRQSETDFLARYRAHVLDQHGKLEPPDFERRRRVPIADIYVPTTISEEPQSESATVSHRAATPTFDVWTLAERIDRSVLLGDPGGGKTTAANVLMHHFAADAERRVPFFVTLREFAANDPPERSVIGHIEHYLETLYQCPPPAGLVDFLLLTGRALVIFDGLDELVDTSRRSDVTTRVEQFCVEYPNAPVLVTSRLVGYDQACLDDRQFSCCYLGRFDEGKVAEYARKWFAQDTDARSGDAEVFLAESESVPDLRSNPLLLSLMCILYRGEGSLPRDRAGVYDKCADLLFRKWDARRRIHQDLRAGHLLEPALRHLAWWLFTRDDAQSAVTERELVARTTVFLHGLGFEFEDDAREAACEFVDFCRGRTWVFSDAGTTASGENLYAFTHRTFLEYFAAAQLAYDSDTPERLALALAPHVALNEWRVVAELAVQIKDRTSNGGAVRIYATLMGDANRWSPDAYANLLQLLALCLRSVDPSPLFVRELARRLLELAFAAERAPSSSARLAGLWQLSSRDDALPWHNALFLLLNCCGSYRDVVADEMNTIAEQAIQSGEPTSIANAIRFAFSVCDTYAREVQGRRRSEQAFWISCGEGIIQANVANVRSAAENNVYVRERALMKGMLTATQALEMRGGLNVLCLESASKVFSVTRAPYLQRVFRALLEGWPAFGAPIIVEDLTAIGEYLDMHRHPPWLDDIVVSRWHQRGALMFIDDDHEPVAAPAKPARLNQAAYLGASALISILVENGDLRIQDISRKRLGPLRDLAPYLAQRRTRGASRELPELRISAEIKKTFHDWAEWKINFIEQSYPRST
jgi:hypothetical protein